MLLASTRVLSTWLALAPAQPAPSPHSSPPPASTPAASPPTPTPAPRSHEPLVIRVATFNLEDVRTEDLLRPDHPRLMRLAEVIQRIRPNVILLNEIAYDTPGAPGSPGGEGADGEAGQNARRFAENFLSVAQAPDLRPLPPLRYRAFMAPSNTGMASGFDLDNDGAITTRYPPPPRAAPDGSPGEQTPGGRAYGNDCWGFGTFPGQYAMALLVDERLTILADETRTFRLLPWSYMSGVFLPTGVDGTGSWFSDEELELFRLSSKSHWDIPVRLPNGGTVHFLCSHPTPPAFDGPERRNARRNHDEIRFWADYLEEAPYIVDDLARPGGLPQGAHFIILGDLNADPEKGSSFKNPIGTLLLSNRRINAAPLPISNLAVEGLDHGDTARFGLRVDYVLPSRTLRVVDFGLWRHPPAGAREFPSDHFPVWLEVEVPPADP